ncbi:MAG: DNA alkylation repair protein [Candidatus Moranbacteria bacterium]|nr:DNA alkylation repair protein [Candidatus Moranbacteria bacterium]
MAKKFKDYYNKKCAELLSEKISDFCPDFDADGFVAVVSRGIVGKEFLARQDVFVEAFEQFLPGPYTRNVKIFMRILGEKLKTTEGMFIHGWWLWPVGRYVEKHGCEDYDLSMNFIYELTQRFTGEFAIRPFLKKFPQETLRWMFVWSKDENVHVRRLASEGVRISLPWAKKSLVFIEHFSLARKILDWLRNDSEKFVQKSVANNLNDLYKIDSRKAQMIVDGWQREGVSLQTAWIIKHGQRSFRKK